MKKTWKKLSLLLYLLRPLPPQRLQGEPNPASLALAQRWSHLDHRAQQQLNQELAPADPREPAIARALSRALPEGLPLMLASSSPVRDWESFAAADASHRPVFGFRGASGIGLVEVFEVR